MPGQSQPRQHNRLRPERSPGIGVSSIWAKPVLPSAVSRHFGVQTGEAKGASALGRLQDGKPQPLILEASFQRVPSQLLG